MQINRDLDIKRQSHDCKCISENEQERVTGAPLGIISQVTTHTHTLLQCEHALTA